jgi:tripartite-type tricarboxylate transporter receptor subunit TctC
MMKRTLRLSLLAFSMALLASTAMAQAFPAKPVTIVVPFPAGGALDMVARTLSEQMRKDLGQPVIVENRAGAGGTVGSASVARATPDGYTILLGSIATHALAPGLYPKLPYDPINDFVPITQLTSSPLVLAVPPQVKAKNLAELVAAANAAPGTLNYGSTGNGTALHIAGEVFRAAAKIDVVHVPYKGGAQASTALLAGEINFIVANPQLVVALIKSEKARALAVTGKTRLAALPDVPTFNEAGVPGVNITTWFGLWAPKNTPPEVVERLNTSARKALATTEVSQQLATQGDVAVGSASKDFSEFVRAEHRYWVPFVQSAGIKID